MDLAMLANPSSGGTERKAAAACAVLAGIAAADAACCVALGERSRGQGRGEAAGLLREITPGGEQAARQFERLIAIKDQAQYGFTDVGGQGLVSAQRQAAALVTFAEHVLAR
jgi:hypothetical protein